MLTRLIGLVVLFVGSAGLSLAADNLTALDLISSDVALCLEVPHLDESWKQFEASPLMARIRAFPVYQKFLNSQSFEQWKTVEDHITRQTGQKLSSQLRAALGKTLVLAMYVPPNSKPQGILIAEAVSPAAIETIVSTWNKVAHNEVLTAKTHHGQRYHLRRKDANSSENIFFVTSGRWLAISDQEGLIQDVIDRFIAATGTNSRSTTFSSLRESRSFRQNRERLKPDSAAYLHISARPWDHVLEEGSRNDREPINPAKIWKHVSTVSASLQIDGGVVCDAAIELNPSNRPSGWSQFVSTAANDPGWNRRIPDEALLAASGQLEIAPILDYLLSQTKPEDKNELAKIRRIAQSILGGNELFDVVLPFLSKDFFGSVVTRTDERTKRVVLDGSIGFVCHSPGDAKLLQDLAHGLETALNLVAAYFSAEGKTVVAVQREQKGSTSLSWLTESAPIPIGYGLKDQTLVVAASQERLRKMLDLMDKTDSQSRLLQHAQKYFPRANQLIWFDTAKVRQVLAKNITDIAQLFSNGSSTEASRHASRLEQAKPYLELVDSLFIAGRVENDHIRVTFGGGLDSK